MQYHKIIEATEDFVKEKLKNAEGGHDWWHIYRVWKLATQLAKNETVDTLVVELGALLHDIADAKFYNGDEKIGPNTAFEFLNKIGVPKNTAKHVKSIIENISYKGGNIIRKFNSPELDVVQDADRLDAIGAIGIGRAFSYGGFKKRAMYNPNIKPNLNMTKEEYKNSTAPTLNHFYEKLLLLKDKMNTNSGKKMAEKRHEFMLNFLKQFYNEWEGEI